MASGLEGDGEDGRKRMMEHSCELPRKKPLAENDRNVSQHFDLNAACNAGQNWEGFLQNDRKPRPALQCASVALEMYAAMKQAKKLTSGFFSFLLSVVQASGSGKTHGALQLQAAGVADVLYLRMAVMNSEHEVVPTGVVKNLWRCDVSHIERIEEQIRPLKPDVNEINRRVKVALITTLCYLEFRGERETPVRVTYEESTVHERVKRELEALGAPLLNDDNLTECLKRMKLRKPIVFILDEAMAFGGTVMRAMRDAILSAMECVCAEVPNDRIKQSAIPWSTILLLDTNGKLSNYAPTQGLGKNSSINCCERPVIRWTLAPQIPEFKIGRFLDAAAYEDVWRDYMKVYFSDTDTIKISPNYLNYSSGQLMKFFETRISRASENIIDHLIVGSYLDGEHASSAVHSALNIAYINKPVCVEISLLSGETRKVQVHYVLSSETWKVRAMGATYDPWLKNYIRCLLGTEREKYSLNRIVASVSQLKCMTPQIRGWNFEYILALCIFITRLRTSGNFKLKMLIYAITSWACDVTNGNMEKLSVDETDFEGDEIPLFEEVYLTSSVDFVDTSLKPTENLPCVKPNSRNKLYIMVAGSKICDIMFYLPKKVVLIEVRNWMKSALTKKDVEKKFYIQGGYPEGIEGQINIVVNLAGELELEDL